MTATKQQRQRLIADWLRGGRIGSQEELVARLGLAGISATQTTVSRDLDELGAVKQRDEGSIRYVLPDRIDRRRRRASGSTGSLANGWCRSKPRAA